MKRVIICSPYAATERLSVEANVQYARRALRDSLDRGEAPLAFHLLYPNVLDDSVQLERAWGIQAGYAWIESADLVAFYTDHGWSPGMIKELKIARLFSRNITVRGTYGGRYDEAPAEVVQHLLDAGIISEKPLPMGPIEGVQIFTFIRKDPK